jgi:hypothetical protein
VWCVEVGAIVATCGRVEGLREALALETRWSVNRKDLQRDERAQRSARDVEEQDGGGG